MFVNVSGCSCVIPCTETHGPMIMLTMINSPTHAHDKLVSSSVCISRPSHSPDKPPVSIIEVQRHNVVRPLESSSQVNLLHYSASEHHASPDSSIRPPTFLLPSVFFLLALMFSSSNTFSTFTLPQSSVPASPLSLTLFRLRLYRPTSSARGRW